MQKIKMASLLDTVEMRGAMDFDLGSEGVTPRRLPDWTRSQIPTDLDTVLRMPSGVRIVFRTDATAFEITALATSFVPAFTERLPVCFELDIGEGPEPVNSMKGNVVYVNGRDPSQFKIDKGEVETWYFSLSPGEKDCVLWLPHNAIVELRHISINDGATISPPRADAADSPLWVHYGSSISHCIEALRPTETWPVVAAKRAGVSVQNLGLAGQCHLDPFIARTIRDIPSDLISIKAGINIVNRDTLRERAFVPALHGFIDTIREKQPTTPVTLISPIFCPGVEEHPGPTGRDPEGHLISIEGSAEIREGSLSLRRIRQLVREIVDRRGDSKLYYVDGLDLLGEADIGDLPDHLHPNPRGYLRMGERYASQHLVPLLQNQSESKEPKWALK